MKTLPALILFAALFAILPPSAFADQPVVAPAVSDYEIINKLPILTAEEMKQVLFYSEIAPVTHFLVVQIQNPFRDKTIWGVVVNITGKDLSTAQNVSFDLFISLKTGPLNFGVNSVNFFKQAPLSQPESHTIITLKEIHYSSANPAPRAKENPPGRSASN